MLLFCYSFINFKFKTFLPPVPLIRFPIPNRGLFFADSYAQRVDNIRKKWGAFAPLNSKYTNCLYVVVYCIIGISNLPNNRCRLVKHFLMRSTTRNGFTDHLDIIIDFIMQSRR